MNLCKSIIISNPAAGRGRWILGPQETQFYTRTYTPLSVTPCALVVFVHGFQEHIHLSLAENGIVLWAFDQQGSRWTALDNECHSKNSFWGKTGCVPVFLLGHSMGGGEVLSFMTQQSYESPCHAETVASLTGVIITSPLIKQTIPVSKTLRWLGEKVATISPYTLIPAAVSLDDLSHSLEFNNAYSKDPLIKSMGTLRGIGEILTEGKKLLSMGCHHWPKKIPFLLIHGDTDKVMSAKATQTFFKVIDTEDKQIMIYPEGLHELQNEPPVIRQKFVTDIVSFVQGRTSTPVPLRDSTHEHTDSNKNIAGVTIASPKSSSSAPNSTAPNTQSSLEIDQDGDVMKVTPEL
ncbi:Alpha/Beta hydrolase protein [Lentinula edodes]|uniref:Alpha/Beta hydrolase protein n=1 Tax=Lentinula lateritia TaxID=40482 RepID=A0A9W8ZNW9_9AGAR|nr:Alpha/Beta hydrolase protein [Lentinula edodes]